MSAGGNWRPTATWDSLRRRGALLHAIRAYFAATGALEVETPTLAHFASTDPALSSFQVPHRDRHPRFLQTSPEFAMKRLLAAGSGDIYQICHAYRQEERSPLHQEEFTLLEWYRIGCDLHGLMDDVAALLQSVGFTNLPLRRTYVEVWQTCLDCDPHGASTAALAALARAQGAALSARDETDRALLLDFIFGLLVLPGLRQAAPLFIYDFPLEHCAYARLRAGEPPVAERFELIINGIEIANGYHEVRDATEQRARHQVENERRECRGLAPVALDSAFLAALELGLPACAGVAIGVDRLLMSLLGVTDIEHVVAFGTEHEPHLEA